ncbi:GEM-like protein 4-like protein [Corchorus olitorius]|uniref:GEM-like protein 4-like protein n=1 Tax=Corchorus olitorius TaxID=93759 RepID=A0A1R3GW63_9ROSI|nr:GEM-like protein 4-like protein [Corchorus olitorius]
MKNQLFEQVIGVPMIKSTTYRSTPRRYLPDANGQYRLSSTEGSSTYRKGKGNFVLKRMNKFAHGVREHVRLGPKITETVKGKLSLGARILQVLIPLEKIKEVNQSVNMKKPSQKYMEIVTVDGFDFWFMGFLNYQKALKYLQQAISQRLLDDVQVTF